MIKSCMCGVSKVAGVLLFIGGLNWGLIGLGKLFGGAGWNLVSMIFGTMPMVEAIVYLLVGISAVVMLFGCKCKKCKDCMAGGAGAQM